MTKTTEIVALFIVLTAVFSFSQNNLYPMQPVKYADVDSLKERVSKLETKLEIGQNEIKKSVDSLNSKFLFDNFIKTAKETQELYNTSFTKIQNSFYFFIVSIGIFTGILVLINLKSTSSSKAEFEKANEIMLDAKKELTIAKKEILALKSELEREINDKKKVQDKFDTSFRFLSRIYRRLAEECLEKNNFHEFFYYMHIFYRCLIKIDKLNEYDLSRLNRTRKSFSDKKNKKQNTLKNKDNICWFIVYLLEFIKHRDNTEHSTVARLIYNDIFTFNFNNLTFDNVKKELEDCMRKDEYKTEEIKEILVLADRYKDKTDNYRP